MLSLLAVGAGGQAQERPVHWTVAGGDNTEHRPGKVVPMRLSARIDEGWYLYSLTQPPGGPSRTTISLAPDPGYGLAGPITAPEPEPYPDRNFNILSEVYRDSVSFTLPVRVEERAAARKHLLVLVRFQTCNDRYCLPARTDTLGYPLRMSKVGAPPRDQSPAHPEQGAPREAHEGEAARNPGIQPSAPAVSEQITARVVEPRLASPGPALPGSGSLPSFLWLAALMGALSLLTPCVYPMVPITISFFSRRDSPSGRDRIGSALLYALGIVSAFTALGVGVTLLFGAGGLVRLAASPWLNLAIAAFLTGFALNLLGVYQIRLPARAVDRLVAAESRVGGRMAAFAMGITFAFTSFTCTGPLVGTLLVLATQGSWLWPALGLGVYATTFALPFLFLAMVPFALPRLPRSGSWMVMLKGALGLLELAAATKFLSNADLVWNWGLLSRDVVITLWAVIALLLALLFLGLLPSSRERAPILHPARLALAAGALIGAGWLVTGLRGARLGELDAFLPPPREGALLAFHDGDRAELAWRLNDFSGALSLAQQQSRPVLVDFTGYTCTNCRWMEANMFPREEVKWRLSRYVLVRLFTDGDGEPYRRQQEFQQRRFGTVALPLYAVVAPSGRTVATFLGMTRDPREFVRFLDAGLAGPMGETVQP